MKKKESEESRKASLEGSLYCCQTLLEIIQNAKMTVANERKLKDAHDWVNAINNNLKEDYLRICNKSETKEKSA